MTEGTQLFSDWLTSLGAAVGLGEGTGWVPAIGIFALVVVGLSVVRHVLLSRLQGVVDRTENVVDDLLLDLVRRTKWPFFVMLGLFLGALVLQLSPGLSTVVRRLFSIALFIQAGVWANYVLSFVVNAYLERRRGQDASKIAVLALFNFFARIAVWTLVLLLVLDNLGVKVATLIAGLGVGGIAIGLALQSVLKDTFASLSIILDKPFEIGDFVIIDDIQGTVQHIGIKTTRILSLNGEELVIGNNDLLSCRIRNYKKIEERRVVQTIRLPLDTPAEKLERVRPIFQEAVDAVEDVRFERAYLKAFGADAVEFDVGFFVTRPDFDVMMDRRQQVNLELHRRLGAEGMRFALPAHAVSFSGAAEGADELPSRVRIREVLEP